jgi:regulator of protease activity HflC (stomatin/prohibitin superfamily)
VDQEFVISYKAMRKAGVIAIWIIAIVSFLTLIGPGQWVTVKSHEVAFTTRFGVVQPNIIGPGLHYVVPLSHADKVTMEFSDLNFMTDGANADPDYTSITSVTNDGVSIEVPVSVSWAIDPRNLTNVKSRLPGPYTDREITIVRSAVRDAMAGFGFKDGSIRDRDAVEKAITNRIQAKTIAYYQAQGFGDQSDKIVRYGLVQLRGMYPTEKIADANEKLVTASLQAQADAARTKAPSDRSVTDYTKVMRAQAVAKAAENGTANVTVVDSEQPVAAVIATGKH